MERNSLTYTLSRAAGLFLAACALLSALPVLAAEIIIDPKSVSAGERYCECCSRRRAQIDCPERIKVPLKITRPLSIIGTPKAVIKGNGKGSAITITASDVTIRGVTVTGSGLLLETQDSGIFISKQATGVRITGNTVANNLIGIYVWGAKDTLVANNKIIGRNDMRVNERGNGVQIWNAPGTVIEGNDISHGRDGIFVTTSRRNIFRANNMHDVRFAVHYMYTNDSEVTDNISRGNHIGYAIMFSRNIKVSGNRSINDRDRGILFNYANRVVVSGNSVSGGPKKCVFIYNSSKNTFNRNRFENCQIGIHFTGGSERNDMIENAFIDNRTQVKYVGTRWLDWSKNGRGNYWSDHTAFDLDGDGIADVAYRPNDLTDQILWRYPAAKLLTNSPAVQLLKWAQSAFPALHPGGVIDTSPLMVPPRPDKGGTDKGRPDKGSSQNRNPRKSSQLKPKKGLVYEQK